ncbi:MAG: hypothetical protein JXB32_12260 [Deltaproteobacteria bacterium]|nr:hypothetical protein [Deltaproteobacteria bacterium]
MQATTVILLALGLGAAAAASARAAEVEDEGLSAAWPFAALAIHTGVAAGAIHGAGWPIDDAMLRWTVGMAAGAVPAGLILWAWGTPCDDGEWRDARALCWTEATFQALVVALVDLAAMGATMWFVQPVPAGVERPSDGLLAGWTVGWAAGSTVALALPPLLGAHWGEDPWSLAGLLAWGHAALATTLLAALYALAAPGPVDDWSVQLPLAVGTW